MRGLAHGLMALSFLVALPAFACMPVDWTAGPLPATSDPVKSALELAYPGLSLDRGAGRVITADGQRVPFQDQTAQGPMGRLRNASIGDQFYYTYPLAFDLSLRRAPFHDPGRLRNDAFFRALWFDQKGDARASLVTVRYPGPVRARFQMTTKHCVHAQLEAALSEIASAGQFDMFLTKAGGSFNWRVISGTERLSAHSFGIAVDFNTELGGYWRWSGAAPGQAADYTNRFPEALVRAMERRGFIWGGKWHHFDGMHFEYRPELILYSRMVGG